MDVEISQQEPDVYPEFVLVPAVLVGAGAPVVEP